MRIVNIRPRVTSVVVEFDTGDTREIANDVAAEFVLYRGKEFTEEQAAALFESQGLFEALTSAHRFIGYRARSEHEVRDKLRRKNIAPAVIERAIGKLNGGGYLNDAVFAEKFVHDALLKKPVGQMRVRHELRRKGVEDSMIEHAIAAQYDAGAEFEAAMRLAQRRANMHAGQPRARKNFSLRQYLLTRGFTRATIDAVAERIFQNDNEQTESQTA